MKQVHFLLLFLCATLFFSCEEEQRRAAQGESYQNRRVGNPSKGYRRFQRKIEGVSKGEIPGSFEVTGAMDDILRGPTECDFFKEETLSDEPVEQVDNLGDKQKLWATNYYTPKYPVDSSGVVLKRKSEKAIVFEGKSVILSEKKFCYAAMEGSVSIDFGNGKSRTFNYEGVGQKQAPCEKYFNGRHAATGKVKFKPANSKWGDGVKNYSLVPYRTIAVDPKKIPYGSVVFIESAKGKKITLDDGTSFIHDGLFFAGDTGGAIKGNHIDVFTGNDKKHDFDFIKSNSSGTFDAQLVKDQAVIEKLTKIHLKRY